MQDRSIPDQKAYVEKWAKENGHTIARWYVDDAISGTSTRDRDDFEQMISDAEAGSDFGTVLCYDLSRFSRGGTNETGYYLHRLKKAGVDAIFCAEGIPEGDEGELIQSVKSWQARQYSVKLARDCIRGQLSHLTQRRSRPGSQAPFGYDRQYLAPDGKLLRVLREMPDGSRQEFSPDGTLLRTLPKGERLPKAKSDTARLIPGLPERVRTVKNIFEWCVDGIGLRTIAMRLNNAGIRTSTGRRWEHSTISSILRNPVFKGSLTWNRRTRAKINSLSPDGTLRPPPKNPSGERNDRDQWITVENTHEPLVSTEVWQQANDQIDRRSKMGGLARPTNRYLLSGLVRCTRCGLNFIGRKGGKRRGCPQAGRNYYMDGAYMRYGRGDGGCDPTTINAGNLEAFVLDQVQQVIGVDSTAVEKAVNQLVKTSQTKARPNDRRSQIEADLKTVNKRITNAMALLTDGDLDDLAELRATLVDLRKRRTSLEVELASNGNNRLSPLNPPDLRTWGTEQLESISSTLSAASRDENLRQVLQSYVISIDIDGKDENGRLNGTLTLPADAMTILEHDLAAISRVNTAKA